MVADSYTHSPGYSGDRDHAYWLVGDFDSSDEAWRVARENTHALGLPEASCSVECTVYTDEGEALRRPGSAPIREATDGHGTDRGAKVDGIHKTEPELGADVIELVDRSAQNLDVTEPGEEADVPPVIRLTDVILAEAIRKSASDIHLEPHEKAFLVRYRIDGVLHDAMEVPKRLQAGILARVKILANLDIAERRLPQDGRISLRLSGRGVELVVSSLPTLFGEKIVLRMLDKSGAVMDLAGLGFEENDLARFKRVIQARSGLILVTGPTGSGTTTTLYAALSTINSPELNIMTVEAPVKSPLPRVTQVNVVEVTGLTFPAAVRAVLRQDPNVILVGELRDAETAQVAVQAARTGRLVFSRLHVHDAPTAVAHLLDMGISPVLVSSALRVVVAQRLCRRVCVECRSQITLPRPVLLGTGFNPEDAESVVVYQATGCAHCANTGYRGRTAIYEILSPELQEAIVEQRPVKELKAIGVKHGMRTLRQAALRKVAQGITTLDEIVQVTPAD